jgi:hypothetical protein
MRAATGTADSLPLRPCSTRMAIAILGFSAGAKQMNQPCGWMLCWSLSRSRRAWVTTCDEPVLPPSLMPASFVRRPVPSSTTEIMPSRTAWRTLGFRPRSTRSIVGDASGRPRTDFSRCGFTSRPPFAITAARRAICTGVTSTWPWPIATETVSPGYHAVFWTRRFHSVLGMSPPISFGRSIPLSRPRPSRFAYWAMRSISSFTPTW